MQTILELLHNSWRENHPELLAGRCHKKLKEEKSGDDQSQLSPSSGEPELTAISAGTAKINLKDKTSKVENKTDVCTD